MPRCLIAALALNSLAFAQTDPDAQLRQRVTEIVHEVHGEEEMPALAVLITRDGKPIVNVATGRRRADRKTAVTTDDVWHLGSCTKSMTATVLAVLVARDELRWDSTIGEVLEAHGGLDGIDTGWHDVTVDQLLRHRSGMVANPEQSDYEKVQATGGTVRERRHAVLRRVLAKPPANEPGSIELYSNAGYMTAAMLGELVTGKSWEELIRTELFEPLGMKSAGFGPPGTEDGDDQPWGHIAEDGKLTPLHHDNPAELGPAGTVHATLADWAKYTDLHLRAMRGEPTGLDSLDAEAFAHLYDPKPNIHYAAGWIVRGKPGRRRLWHNGSNTMWYVQSLLFEADDVAILIATNLMEPKASDIALRRILAELKKQRDAAGK